ncbi:MAG: DMT family transporter [Acidobacteriia bacterium]|nr:DMT family transporter [Terriglobia bacterium]
MIVPSGFASAAFGLASAAAFGTADFSGGIASKRAQVFGVLTVARACGLTLMLALAWITHEHLPSTRALLWACAAGFVGGLALPALYRALAIGKMGIAAPVTSVLSAALPVVVAALTEGLPHMLQICGLVLALIALWFISRPEGKIRPQGLGLALFAGLGFGSFLVFMRQASAEATYWPLAAALATSLILAAIILIAQRGSLPGVGVLPVVLAAGLLDTFGNFFFILASQRGRLDVAAVLSSLYPAVTVLLARLLLKERITRIQTAGMTAALIAVPLIAAR